MARLGIAVAQCLLGLMVLDMAQPVGAAQGELVDAKYSKTMYMDAHKER